LLLIANVRPSSANAIFHTWYRVARRSGSSVVQRNAAGNDADADVLLFNHLIEFIGNATDCVTALSLHAT